MPARVAGRGGILSIGQFMRARLKIRPVHWLVGLLAAAGGCVDSKLEKRLEAAKLETAGQTSDLNRLNQAREAFRLDWKTALKLLDERNLTLRQGRSRLEQVRKERDEQWKTWIPRVGVNANLLSSLSELGALSASNMSASVVAPLAIPNPMTEQATAMANALAYLEARDGLELSYRRQVANLYRLFSRYEALLAREALAGEAATGRPDLGGALATIENRAAQKESRETVQDSLAQLLNLPGRHPLPVPATRPRLDYGRRIHTLEPGRNYGQLALRLSAYQIESALLNEKGVKLRQWPTVWFSGSTPALYDSRDSSSSDFNADNIYLFGGLSRSYDITGRDFQNVRTAEENTEFVRQNLRLRLDQESREWLRLRERYAQLQTKRKLLGERLGRMRGSQGPAFAELTTLRQEYSTLAQVDSAIEQLELELWVWDEEKWR